MFSERDLPEDVAAVRDEHAADALVLDCDRDFETLPVPARDDLALLTRRLDPFSCPGEWLPEDAPELLRRFAGSDLVVGMPGDGSVAWTRQTDPPVVFVKARVQGSPDDFVDFLLAEALVEVGLERPEQFLGFFDGRYRDFATAIPLDSGSTYQLAAALYDAHKGLRTREVFAEWDDNRDERDGDLAERGDRDESGGDDSADDHPRLAAAWRDAGERIEPRLDTVMREVARGTTDFADAAELACSAIKHGIEPPAPFAALDTGAYRDHGADYAVKWAEKVFD